MFRRDVAVVLSLVSSNNVRVACDVGPVVNVCVPSRVVTVCRRAERLVAQGVVLACAPFPAASVVRPTPLVRAVVAVVEPNRRCASVVPLLQVDTPTDVVVRVLVARAVA